MSRFALTNRQRKYFGLAPAKKQWDPVELKDMLVYFDGDLIRKVICYEIGKEYGYQEFDYELETDAREKLLPATKRGKPKPLTPSNILDRKPIGFSFICYFGIRGKTLAFQHLYVTHVASDDSFVSLHDHGITDYEQLSDWVDEFIKSCPPDHLEKVTGKSTQKKRRVRYQPGDLFEIPFNKSSVGYGKILLDVHRLRKTGFLDHVCPEFPYGGLNGPLLGSGLMVAVFKYAGPRLQPEEIAAQPILYVTLMMHDNIYEGKFPLVGKAPVLPEELDFPEGVSQTSVGKNKVIFHFEKGGVCVRLPMTKEEFRDAPQAGCAFGLAPRRILKAIRGDEKVLNQLISDLRCSEQRAEILSRCGLKPEMSYAEMAAQTKGLSPEAFIAASQQN